MAYPNKPQQQGDGGATAETAAGTAAVAAGAPAATVATVAVDAVAPMRRRVLGPAPRAAPPATALARPGHTVLRRSLLRRASRRQRGGGRQQPRGGGLQLPAPSRTLILTHAEPDRLRRS
ncbi:hypothetical protein [Tessaracoccus coleopterorum]|uniref:hypothetical protein n=1 Tax=Tessaracoccus coleopterorum TaxID=2714950 RepID=UPI001E2CF53A|nr:hypothetical protein [Tessaracoccus coleopterorum]